MCCSTRCKEASGAHAYKHVSGWWFSAIHQLTTTEAQVKIAPSAPVGAGEAQHHWRLPCYLCVRPFHTTSARETVPTFDQHDGVQLFIGCLMHAWVLLWTHDGGGVMNVWFFTILFLTFFFATQHTTQNRLFLFDWGCCGCWMRKEPDKGIFCCSFLMQPIRGKFIRICNLLLDLIWIWKDLKTCGWTIDRY